MHRRACVERPSICISPSVFRDVVIGACTKRHLRLGIPRLSPKRGAHNKHTMRRSTLGSQRSRRTTSCERNLSRHRLPRSCIRAADQRNNATELCNVGPMRATRIPCPPVGRATHRETREDHAIASPMQGTLMRIVPPAGRAANRVNVSIAMQHMRDESCRSLQKKVQPRRRLCFKRGIASEACKPSHAEILT